jgi:hypothetical protein
MKAVKISLAVIVVAVIGFFVIQSVTTIDKVAEIDSRRNQFIERIEQEIDSLAGLSDSKFCKEFYNEVGYHIADYHKQERLGNNQLENDQWKEILSKNLFSVYVGKFIKQAFYVFRGSEWDINALKFIRSEYQTLQKSALLERGSAVDKEFTKIRTIFAKYDEITGFILSCKKFSYLGIGLYERFPITDVKSKISQAAIYSNNRLENELLNNCTRLHDGLKEVPQVLFKAHVRYLDNKISARSESYSRYDSQLKYADELYKPLKSEIDALDNDIYNVPNFDSEYTRLSNKWSKDNEKAYDYSY